MEQLTSSYAEYCEAFTAGLTEESHLYQEDQNHNHGHGQSEREIVSNEKSEREFTRKKAEEEREEGGNVKDMMGKEAKGGEETKGREERAILCNEDQREILHWLRDSDEEEEQDSGSNGEDVPLRVSPPARILTPARYEQSRRTARQHPHGKQEHHEDDQQQQQRHAWWAALRVGWTRMRRRTSKAAIPDYN
ncbi:hypothetical protein AbraIFM66951_009100 [Aspergillus brasiliensis]|nr:hypothetical protein AbraIFM66951_009100 [Aspergillus brasiliensis]